MISNKKVFLLYGLVSVLLIGQSGPIIFAEEFELPKKFRVSEHYMFYGSGGIDWQSLRDPDNNPILITCLHGATSKSLRKLDIPNLQGRLARLERGNLIRKTKDGYTLAFPAVIGQKKDLFRKHVQQVAQMLLPMVEKMIEEIQPQLAGRNEMLYHVLWSVIMDGHLAWNAAKAQMNKQVNSGDTTMWNTIWLLYPLHPFLAGTNFHDTSVGRLHITWSRNTPSVDEAIVFQNESELVRAIKQGCRIEKAEAKDALSKYGLVDESGVVRIYTIESSSKVAEVYMNLGTKFGQQIVSHLDVPKVAKILDTSPGLALVIAYHETCWQLLQELTKKKVLNPLPTAAGDAYQLVSLVIFPKATYPFLETEMSAEEKTTIERFNEIKMKILAGEKYFNLSTPVDGLLSCISAVLSRDGETLNNSSAMAMKMGGPIPPAFFKDSWIKQCKNICIYRVESLPPKIAEGDVHPIYVMNLQEKKFSDVYVFIYWEGKWLQLFQNGDRQTDWRGRVEWMNKTHLR